MHHTVHGLEEQANQAIWSTPFAYCVSNGHIHWICTQKVELSVLWLRCVVRLADIVFSVEGRSGSAVSPEASRKASTNLVLAT